ncbi:MAG: flagellar hook-basal body complex protein [Planctomycetota bacterium]
MVSTALYTGLSGLRLHQSYIDVIGNNLANVTTAGFRGARPTFSDILSFTVRTGSGPSGNLGGLNPLQLGHGAIMSTVDTDINQGTFQDTGRPLDVALQGKGFFTLSDGLQRFYTRVGTFGIDNDRTLVDLRSGLRVLNSSGSNITVPVSDTLPAQPTSSVTFQGNLPARVSGPLFEIVESAAIFKQGDPASKLAQGTAGAGNQFDLTSFTNGGSILVSVNGGAQQTVTFPSATFGGGPVTASQIAAQFSVAGLSVTADDLNGTIDFDTVRLGDNATLKFDDGPGSSGMLAALGLNATLSSGSEQAATATTDLANLTARRNAYQDGDQITISGTNPDNTAFSNTFVYGVGNDGTTLQDLIDFVNQNTIDGNQSTMTLTADGHLRLTADAKGPGDLSLSIGDVTGNSGQSNWSNFTVTQNGTGPDTAVTSIEVIDSQGLGHTVTMTFTRSENDSATWDMVATMDATEGSISQDSIGQIRFNDDGSFNVIGGGSNTLQFDFTGISTSQSVSINLGTSGQFDGIAMLGDAATLAATDQDGFGSGTLLNAGFNTDGELTGFYSNGQSRVLDTLRVTMFANEAGLLRIGDTMFVESPNSDDPIFTVAGSAGAGTVRPGSLENSNVDIAREFVNLIEAQRGFQANSRVITTTDEILAELINIVR